MARVTHLTMNVGDINVGDGCWRRFIILSTMRSRWPIWDVGLVTKITLLPSSRGWQWCWWHRYVGGFMMVTDFRCWWQNHFCVFWLFLLCWWFFNVLNWSPTSQTCHQHIWSPTSVINIVVTTRWHHFERIWNHSKDFRSTFWNFLQTGFIDWKRMKTI